MPDIEFLEKYPLYRKFEIKFPPFFARFSKVNLNMYCKNCGAIRTFVMLNYYKDLQGDIRGEIFQAIKEKKRPLYVPLIYLCASCNRQYRIFLLKLNEDFKHIEKIGQEPPWGISLEKEMEEILGDFAIYYKNGKICESQSYGIGAFAYYRRMIEGIIDHLLDLIPDLIDGEDKIKYEDALKKTKETKVTEKKIELVYDLLPPILNPREFNPLKTLHERLSEGLHGRKDEECLKDAEILRESIIFLVKAILQSRKERMEFTDKMRKILQKKRENMNNL